MVSGTPDSIGGTAHRDILRVSTAIVQGTPEGTRARAAFMLRPVPITLSTRRGVTPAGRSPHRQRPRLIIPARIAGYWIPSGNLSEDN